MIYPSQRNESEELIMTIDKYTDWNTLPGEIVSYIAATRSQMVDDEKRCAAILELDQPVGEYTPFVVSFVGRFKTGKSSLINALLGMDILPTKATTATTVITRIIYGPTMCAYVRERGNLRPVSIREAQEVILNHKVSDVNNTPDVIFELPVDWLKGNIELRDTPGMDDSAQNGLLEAIALNALKDTDLCVLVYDAYQFISAKEREITQKAQEQLGGNIVFAVNRTNLINSIEGLNQVEKAAKTVFSGMGNDLVGNDRHYLMCSAPGMVDLDGFDVWLKDILAPGHTDRLNSLRKRAVSSGISEMYEEVSGGLKGLVTEASDLLSELSAEHKRRIDKAQQEINRARNNRRNKVLADRLKVELALCDTTGLQAHIKEKRSGNAQSYDAFSKVTVRDFYSNKAAKTFTEYAPYMKTYGYDFIGKAVNSLTFPSTHTKTVAASGREVGGGAIFGGVIGFLFGGPAGAAVCAGIGAALGGSSSSVDDSESNTVSFVQSNVLNSIKTQLYSVFSREVQRIDSEAASKCAVCKSGLEVHIDAMRSLMQDLNRRLISEQLSRMEKYAKQYANQ